MSYIIKLLTLNPCFCKGHLLFKNAQLISDGTGHMVLSTRNLRTLSTESTISVGHRLTSVNNPTSDLILCFRVFLSLF